VCGSYNPARAETPTVWAGPRSLATTWGVTFVFRSSRYLDVSVPWVGSIELCVYSTVTGLQPAGFPHSGIRGSKDVCSSPRLNAAYHALHRLLVPRHPPRALTCLSHSHGSRIAFVSILASRCCSTESNPLCLPPASRPAVCAEDRTLFDSTTAINTSKNGPTWMPPMRQCH
jgi:hypothetical protein